MKPMGAQHDFAVRAFQGKYDYADYLFGKSVRVVLLCIGWINIVINLGVKHIIKPKNSRGGFWILQANLINSIVPISRFNKGGAGKILEEVDECGMEDLLKANGISDEELAEIEVEID